MTAAEIVLTVLCCLLVLGLIALVFYLFKSKSSQPINANDNKDELISKLSEQNIVLQERVDQMVKSVDSLSKAVADTGTTSKVDINVLKEQVAGLANAQSSFNKFNTEIKTNLESLERSTKNLPSMSSSLKDISNIYRNAKARGNFGEIQLKIILEDIFGKGDIVKEQYHLPDGNGIVDYAIVTDDEVIAIDSKFPLDNYPNIENKDISEFEFEDLKKKFKTDVNDKIKELNKYVSRKNKISTVILFIPSESIFSDIITWFGNDLLMNASTNSVFLSSPTTLQVIIKLFAQNLKDKNLSKNLDKIKENILKINDDWKKCQTNWLGYAKTLSTLDNKAIALVTSLNNVGKGFNKLSNNKEVIEENNRLIDQGKQLKEEIQESSSLLKSTTEVDE